MPRPPRQKPDLKPYDRIQGPFRDYIPRLHAPKVLWEIPGNVEKVPTLCMLKVDPKYVTDHEKLVNCGHCTTVLTRMRQS